MTKDFSERVRSVLQLSRNTLVLHLRFAFVEEGYDIPSVPVWAMKLVLTKEEIEEMRE